MNTSGLARGGKKGAPKPSKLLRDMRAVYDRPEDRDPPNMGAGQTAMRALLKKDPVRFVTLMSRQEAELRSRSVAGKVAGREASGPSSPPGDGGDGEPEYDAGTTRAFGLIEEFLAGWKTPAPTGGTW